MRTRREFVSKLVRNLRGLSAADAKRLAAFDTLIWDAELGRVFGHEHYQHAVVSLSRSSELYELATG